MSKIILYNICKSEIIQHVSNLSIFPLMYIILRYPHFINNNKASKLR